MMDIMMKRCIGVLLVVFLLGVIPEVDASFFGEKKNFDVDNALLKLVVKEGESSSKILKLTSYEENDFMIEKSNLDFVEVVDPEFFMSVGEERDVQIIFNGEGKDAGVYLGS